MKIESIATKIVDRAAGINRLMVAVAGPPGAGKSTLAEQLKTKIVKLGVTTVIVPMDGFHLSNEILDERGLRARKGSPETFDATGFIDLIEGLRNNSGPISVPEFDRSIDAVVKGNSLVEPSDKVLLVEGNYLLLQDPPWDQLPPLFDLSIFINPGFEVLRERLVQRWLDYGHDFADAERRAMSNDIPNAQTVLDHSSKATMMLKEFS